MVNSSMEVEYHPYCIYVILEFVVSQVWCRRKNTNIQHLNVHFAKRLIRRKNCDQLHRVCQCHRCHQALVLSNNRYFNVLRLQLERKNRVHRHLHRTKNPVSVTTFSRLPKNKIMNNSLAHSRLGIRTDFGERINGTDQQ